MIDKRIKLFIITYNNEKDINNNLNSLFQSDLLSINLDITIINNHSNFKLHNYNDRVKVIHNSVRPDFSTGHLARSWNQCIINGFKELNNPDCDILITCQDDTIFYHDWLSQLLKLHETYDFIQMGVGDNFCSYLPSAVKTIGLWDEHFCGLGFGEGDYFLRALIYNRHKSCINDHQHGRLINPVNFSLCERPAPPNVFSADHRKSMNFHYISEKVFKAKWGDTPPNYWDEKTLTSPPTKSLITNFIFYPYFEKDISNLEEKGYLI